MGETASMLEKSKKSTSQMSVIESVGLGVPKVFSVKFVYLIRDEMSLHQSVIQVHVENKTPIEK